MVVPRALVAFLFALTTGRSASEQHRRDPTISRPQVWSPWHSRNRSGEGREVLRGGVGNKLGGYARRPEPRTKEGALVFGGRSAGVANASRVAVGRGGGALGCGGSLGPVTLTWRGWGQAPALDSTIGPSGGRSAATGVFSRGRCSGRWAGWGGRGGGPRLAAHTSPIIKHYVQKAPGDFPEPRSPSRSAGWPTEPMDLSAAAALCLWLLSACRPRDGLEAAAVLRAAGAGPAWGPGSGGSGSGSGGQTLAPAAGASAVQAAAAPGARTVRRAAGPGFRNGSVVPHHFMMSLYRSLAGRAPAEASSWSHGRADTITGFVDQATQGTLRLFCAQPSRPILG